jgi:[ribosomal protein S5]-alanine N-acetyltransferase
MSTDGVVMHTARLRLRRFTYEDAPFLVALLNDPAFLLHIGDRGVRTESDARQYLDFGPLASYSANNFGLWCVERLDTGAPIGTCGLLKRPTLDDVDVGYALIPDARGAGYAREAVAGVLQYARETLNLHKVVAIVAPGNLASIRVMESLGYRADVLVTSAPGHEPVMLYQPSL